MKNKYLGGLVGVELLENLYNCGTTVWHATFATMRVKGVCRGGTFTHTAH